VSRLGLILGRKIGNLPPVIDLRLNCGQRTSHRHGVRFSRSRPAQNERAAMLRITCAPHNESHPSVKLEGKLLEAWVTQVDDLFPPSDIAPLPRLDLADVTFVDAAGVALLRQLLHRGVQLNPCSPYVAELLQRSRNPLEEV
jgi:hypothetical protein